jgi:hypothetical protein
MERIPYNIIDSDKLILILGGIIVREITSFNYALNNTNDFIILSGGTLGGNSILSLLNHNILLNKIKLLESQSKEIQNKLKIYWNNNPNKMNFLYNYKAKDTIDNFLTMKKEIDIYLKYNKKGKDQSVYIYTSEEHQNRASYIAFHLMKLFKINYKMVNINSNGIMTKLENRYYNDIFNTKYHFTKFRVSLFSKNILLFEEIYDKYNKFIKDKRIKWINDNLKYSDSLTNYI